MEWAIPYPEETAGQPATPEVAQPPEVEPPAKVAKVEWFNGPPTMEKLAKMACKVVGRDPEEVDRDMYDTLFCQLYTAIQGVEIVDPPKQKRALPKGQAARGRGRGNSNGVTTHASNRGGRGGSAPFRG
eukprot:Phypoly_transcript_21258.p1 GENE.Phypoly_transcript_21258~~Phypoly_transcript_21258.p1  ORF type:complete len:129 (-),score=23.96 Phypoly_transcript_21258:42-428(-)